MAGPKKLVEAVAKAMGVSEATVTVHDRNLAVSGLRTVGGRGRAAAQMSPRDAANLMIAVAAGSTVKDSAAIVQRQGAAKCRERWAIPFLPIPEVLALPAGHTLADALEALIASAQSGSMQRAVDVIEAGADLVNQLRPPVRMEVAIFDPTVRAHIEIALVEYDDGTPAAVQSEVKEYQSGRLADAARAGRADLHHRHIFTHASIIAIGDLLRGEDT